MSYFDIEYDRLRLTVLLNGFLIFPNWKIIQKRRFFEGRRRKTDMAK